jgi:hypothetical protein
MSSFKKLSKADVTTVDYKANKQWNLSYIGNPNDTYIIYYTGSNSTFSKSDATLNNQYPSLIYSQINHLFYQNYTSSLNTGSLKFNLDTYTSASQQRPTASYFNYNTNPLLIKQFPSASGNKIGVLNINQDIYGSKILPTSFQISASNAGYLIKDDGNGNLYDMAQVVDQYIDLEYLTLNYFNTGNLTSGVFFVGNIFYAHGLITITNPDYISTIFTNGGNNRSSSFSFQNEHIIYENEVNCIVRESDYNLSYNPTLLKYGGQYITPISGSNSIMTGSNNSFKLTGSFDSTVKDFATGSFFQPYVTTIGLYNDENELLMVAKLGKPIALSSDTDMTFIVKYDT